MKKTAFWIFTVTSIFLASFKSALAAPATSPMGLAVQTIIGLVTPIFDAFSKTNEQGITLIKFVLWLLLFAVLFSVSGPLFKGRKAIAGIVAGVIALISVVMIPGQMVLTIAYEYSGIATFIFLVAPIFCMFWLNKKIPDTPIGDAMKFFIYLVMAILAWKLIGSAQQMTTPFLKDIVGSVWWTLFALIVSAAAARYLWKFGASTFAGPHMEKVASWAGETGRKDIGSWFKRKPKVNPALTPPTTPTPPVTPPPVTPPTVPPGGTGPTPSTTPPVVPQGGTTSTPAQLSAIQKFEKDIQDFENRRRKLSDNELKETSEQQKHVERTQKLLLEAIGISQTLTREGTDPNVAAGFRNKLGELKQSINVELSRIANLNASQIEEFRIELADLEKEPQEINSVKTSIVSMQQSIDSMIPNLQANLAQFKTVIDQKNKEIETQKTLMKSIPAAGQKNAEEGRKKLEKELKQLNDRFNELESNVRRLQSTKTVMMPALNMEADKILQQLRETRDRTIQIPPFITSENDIIQKIYSMEEANLEALTGEVASLINSIKKRKILIIQKEDMSGKIKEDMSKFEYARTQLLSILYGVGVSQ